MNRINNEQEWLNAKQISETYKKAYVALDEIEKREMFQTYLPFGTGGMRGLMGIGPSRINNITIARAAFGYGKLLQSLSVKPKVVIGYDNRNGSAEFARTSARVLSAMGCKVFLFSELMATPIISYAIRDLAAQGGIIITASHNPPAYNGFKVYDETGCQLLPEHITKVTDEIEQIEDIFAIAENDDAIEILPTSYINKYVEKLASYIVDTTTERTLSIGFSPQHGTALAPALAIFKKFNYPHVKIVVEQATFDGNFTNTESPNPEDPVAFKLLETYGEKYQLDILATTDPDADRLGIAYRDTKGTYVQLTGNQVGALLIDYYTEIRKIDPEHDYIVKTIVTAELGATIARAKGVDVIEVLTGFKYIGDIINQKGEAGFVAGYEESYGYLLYPFTRDKDGLQILLAVAEMANAYKLVGKTLGTRLEELSEEYGYFEEKLLSFDLVGVTGMKEMQALYDKMHAIDWLDIICKEDYENRTKTSYPENFIEEITLETAQVLKFYLADDAWFCIRPSGTEPKLKIYLGVKARDALSATDAIIKLETRIRTYLGKQ